MQTPGPLRLQRPQSSNLAFIALQLEHQLNMVERNNYYNWSAWPSVGFKRLKTLSVSPLAVVASGKWLLTQLPPPLKNVCRNDTQVSHRFILEMRDACHLMRRRTLGVNKTKKLLNWIERKGPFDGGCEWRNWQKEWQVEKSEWPGKRKGRINHVWPRSRTREKKKRKEKEKVEEGNEKKKVHWFYLDSSYLVKKETNWNSRIVFMCHTKSREGEELK